MKIAIISDIHGNHTAFKKVWEEVKNFPLILNAGDMTGAYPDINLVINELQAKNVKNIIGNHDRVLIENKLPSGFPDESIKPFEHDLKNISPKNLLFLKTLKPAENLEIEGLKIGLYHGSPFDPDEYIYPDSSLSRFKKLNFDVLILGNTHWSMIRKIGKMTIVNPGSVGQPRNYDNRASYAILDTEDKTIQIKRVKYNITETINKIKKLNYHPELIKILKRTNPRVLVTAASGGSVGEQIYEALRMSHIPYYIVTTNIEAEKNGLYEADAGYLIPPASSNQYISKLLTICHKEKIQVLIPGSAPELDTLSKCKEKFAKNGILVLTNSQEVIEICQDKLKTMEFLQKNNLLFPKFAILSKPKLPLELKFPVVLKPTTGGGGSRNVYLLQDQNDLNYYYQYFTKHDLVPLVQEYIGDATQEYTVGVLTDFDGELLGSLVMKREVKGDLSVRTEIKNSKKGQKPYVISTGFSQGIVDDYPEVRKYCEKIALALGSRGPLNIQCRKTSKGIYVMEINPRFSGTAAIRALLGFNEPDTLIRKYVLKQKIGPIKYKKGLVLRDLRMVYIGFDQIGKINRQKFIKNK